MSKESAGKPVTETLGDIERAFDIAVAAIRSEPDHGRAYAGATELVETLRRLFEKSAALRAESAARIFESEEMSLARLADRIGVSKARAAQLIKSASMARIFEAEEMSLASLADRVSVSKARATKSAKDAAEPQPDTQPEGTNE